MAGKVAVIGGGLAGIMAALSARREGSEVTLLSRSLGRTALSSGLLALADIPGLRYSAGDFVIDDLVASLLELRPHHPYAKIERPRSDLLRALSLLIRVTGDLYASPDENLRILDFPNEIGALSRAQLGPKGRLASRDLKDEDLHLKVVGFHGFPRFRLGYIGQLLETIAGKGCRVEEVELNISNNFGLFPTPVSLARFLDDEEGLGHLIDELKPIQESRRADVLVFPPVLGWKRTDIAERISEEVGADVYELSPAQFSVPGMRLVDRLHEALDAESVKRVSANITGFQANGERLAAVVGATDEDGEKIFEADAFVLATGKYLAGGIRHGYGRFEEAIFDLPLWESETIIERQFVERLTDRDFLAAQRLSRIGLRVDRSWRPLNRDLRPEYDNLFAAGHVLGGFDPYLDGSSQGVDLVTGFLAGQKATEAK